MNYFYKSLRVVTFTVAVAVLGNEMSFSQSLGQSNPKPRQANSGPRGQLSPVTKSEVFAIFQKVDQAIAKSIVQDQSRKGRRLPTDGIASRSEIISEFDRIYHLCKPKFKYTANPGLTEPQLITIPGTDPSRKMVENLIIGGFIGRYDPIATSKMSGMLPEDFGFAVAQFLGRLCELTHTPSSKFSPTMMRTDG